MDASIKNTVFGILSIGISLVIAAGLLEIYVRLVETDGSNFDIEMWRYARDLKRVSDIPNVGHEHIPGKGGIYMGVSITTSSVGWRDNEHSVEKKNGTIRIMMLGDSLTLGWGAPPEDVTSHQLERTLNAGMGQRFEVLNTGIGNANTVMEAAYFLNKGYIYNPDIVVLNYFINDAEPTPKRRGNFFTEHFYSAVFISGRFDVVMRRFFGKADWHHYYQALYGQDRPGWLATRSALKELADYCKSRNIKLLIAHYPELHELSPYPFQSITSLISSQAAVLEVPFLDLLPSVQNQEPSSLWVTETDPHPNGKAARRYADSIAKFLLEQGLAT